MSEVSDLDSLRAELAETQNSLQMAAEFGNALLEKNQVLEADQQALENRLQAREEEIEQLRSQLDEQEHVNRQLKQKMEDVNNQDTTDISEYENKIKMLKSKYNNSKDHLKDVTTLNTQLSEEIAAKESMIIKYRGIDKELLKNRQEMETIITEKDNIQTSLNTAKEQITDLKRELSNVKVELKKSEGKQDELQLVISDLKLQLTQKGSSDKGKYNQIMQELQEAEDAIEELEKDNGELKYAKKQLEKTVADFAIQNQQLHKEKEENLRFLEEARTALANYRQKEEEKEFEDSVNSIVDADRPDNSLLGELEQELETRLVVDGESVKKTPPPGAPENCEEFFFLAATAVKIAFAMQAPKTSDGCFRINIKSLYQQALDAEVPFHEWYDWIKLQLASKQESLMTSVTSSPGSRVNRVSNPRPRRTVSTARHVSQPTVSGRKKFWFNSWF